MRGLNICRYFSWYCRKGWSVYPTLKDTISEFPSHLAKRLTEAAKAKHLTKSELVRQSVEAILNGSEKKKTPSCYDLTRDLIDAAATRKRVPRDLATNPKYMKGYGE